MALDTWSGPFVKDVLDNPVYCGKIAYGRRVRERKKGSKYEYITVNSDDYILLIIQLGSFTHYKTDNL